MYRDSGSFEARASKLIHIGTMAALVSVFAFNLLFASIDIRAMSTIIIVAFLLAPFHYLTIYFNKNGYSLAAAISFNLQICLMTINVTVFNFGSGPGLHYFFLLYSILPFLTLPFKNYLLILGFIIINLGLFIYVENFISAENIIYSFPAQLLPYLWTYSVMASCVSIIIVIWLNQYYLNQSEVEIEKQSRTLSLQNQNLIELNKQILNQNAELEVLNSTKDKFFSIVSHDLKSPFQGFLGATALFAEDVDKLTQEEIKSMGTKLFSNAKNLYDLLKNLLSWAEMQRGIMPFEPKIISLTLLAEESITLVQGRGEEKGVTVFNNIKEPCNIFADENMIRSVLLNLLTNAIKFTANGGQVSLNVNPKDEKMFIVYVTDTGTGISHEDQLKLFDIDIKFTRKGTDNEESTGLGLLLCKEFVHKNGGEIYVKSDLGIGSTIYFTIPAG